MKAIVIYASKYGSTKKAAVNVATKLNALLADINEGMPDITDFDVIILGSNVRYGQVNKDIKKFIKQNKKVLFSKKFALFVCSASEGTGEKYFKDNFSADVLEKAVTTANLGGEIHQNDLAGFDKFLMKMIAGRVGEPSLDEHTTAEFIKKIMNTEG